VAFRSLGMGVATRFLLVLAGAFGPGLAHAGSDLDLCNDVLRQDLFNRTSGSSQASASERAAYLTSFFDKDEDSAYAEYKAAYDEHKNDKLSGHGEGHYGIIGGELDFQYEHGAAMSKEDFSKTFSQAKHSHQGSTSSSSSKDTSLISTYTTAVRDPGTIEAWRTCMQTKTSEPSVFAYGYRDPNGNPYLTVMWAPGNALAAILPRIQVRFVVPEEGVEIEGGDLPVEISTGSGAAFAIRYKDAADSRARFGGFVVIVNATANDGDRKVKDFHEEATIPPPVGAVPCELLFKGSGSYPIALYPEMEENRLNAAAWRVYHLRLEGTEPAAPAGAIAYHGWLVQHAPEPPLPGRIFGPTETPVRLSLRGVNVELEVTNPGKPSSTGTGECVFGMARGSIRMNNRMGSFSIRASQ
jgi:hypothetical protein